MSGNVSNRPSGKRDVVKYVACSNARRGVQCTYVQWDYKDLEGLILHFCKMVDLAQVLGVNKNAEADLHKAEVKLQKVKQEIDDVNGRNQALLDQLEKFGKNDIPQVIFDRIVANTAKVDSLRGEETAMNDQIIKLRNARVDVAVQQNLIVELQDKLKNLKDHELHTFRIRLSEAVRRVITQIVTYPGGRWYTAKEIEHYRRDLASSDDSYTDDEIKARCAKLDAKPNKSNRLLMLVFRNGEHRTVLASGKVLDRKTAPPSEWDVPTLFKNLKFQVFKHAKA